MILKKKSAEDKKHDKLPSLPIVKQVCIIHKLLGKPRNNCGRLNTCDFVCGTKSHAVVVALVVIHYQVTFE